MSQQLITTHNLLINNAQRTDC